MTSSYSQNGVELQGAGDNTNTWGDPKLNNALKRLNFLFAGYQSIALTGDYTLTTSNTSTSQADFQAWNGLLKFTGAPVSNPTVTVPSTPMQWQVWNGGNRAMVLTTGAGSTATVDAGDVEPVWTDGAGVHQITFGGMRLKDFIAASVLAATGALPATAGNNGKVLACVAGSWTPTLIDPTYLNAFSATASIIRTGTSTVAALTPGDVYNALAEVTLTDAATIALDMSTFINAVVTLAGNRTLGNPTNPKVGQTGRIRVVQDGTGSRTLAFSSNWKRPGGAPTLTTTAAANDFIYYEVITTTYILYDIKKNPT